MKLLIEFHNTVFYTRKLNESKLQTKFTIKSTLLHEINIMSDIATLRIQPTAVQHLLCNIWQKIQRLQAVIFRVLFNQQKHSSSSLLDKIFDHVQSPKRAPLVLIWGVRYVRFMYMYAFPCDVFTYVVPKSRASVPGHDSLLTLMSVWMNDCNCWSVSILLENCFAVFLDLLF